MRLTFVDIETTGLDVTKGHRIVEIAMLMHDLDSGKQLLQYVQRINPERAIDAGAQAVHGITFAELAHEPTWDAVAPKVHKILEKSDFMIAHNADFDAPFVGIELQRLGFSIPDINAFCTMKEGRWATPLGKNPNLGELCFALDIPYNPAEAHAALYDITKTMEAFFAGYRRGFYQLPAAEAMEDAA